MVEKSTLEGERCLERRESRGQNFVKAASVRMIIELSMSLRERKLDGPGRGDEGWSGLL